jgi:peptidoglycan/xylan/chitin deacetylase (PgdA/CDA1 family)/GNAT superfamily N-acetyltransferase
VHEALIVPPAEACDVSQIRYDVWPNVSDDALNELFAAAWKDGFRRAFAPVHERSLVYLCAFEDERLIGYVNIAWDGGIHAFLLDPTVHPDARRRGVGTELVRRAVAIARMRGARWVHVDFEPELTEFYRRCGFAPTAAGLIDLRPVTQPRADSSRRSPALRKAGRALRWTGTFAMVVGAMYVPITFVGAELSARSARSPVVNVRRVIATPIPTPSPPPSPSPPPVPYASTPGDGVAITFDDGPDPVFTPQVLDILDRYHVKATFFVIGRSAARYPDLVRSIVARGHAIGGHTWSHANLTKLDQNGLRREVDDANRYLHELTGRPVACVRPPSGRINAHVLDELEHRNLDAVKWTDDTRDWTEPGSSVIIGRVAAGLHPGAIVLMHDGGGFRGQTVEALPRILEVIKATGLPVHPIC